MNLADYKNQGVMSNLVNKEEDNVGIVLPSIPANSTPVSILIEPNALGKLVSYWFDKAIPDDAIIVVKSIVFYGFTDNNQRLVNASNELVAQIFIDNMYANPSMKVYVEFEQNQTIYKIDQEILLDTSKEVELTYFSPPTKYLSPTDMLTGLLTRIVKLEKRVSILEKRSVSTDGPLPWNP